MEYSAFFASEPVSACDAEDSSLAIGDKPVSGGHVEDHIRDRLADAKTSRNWHRGKYPAKAIAQHTRIRQIDEVTHLHWNPT